MKVLDDFLPENEFKPIQATFTRGLPWHYNSHITENTEAFQFTHTFFNVNNPFVSSRFCPLIQPVLTKLKPWALLRAKANLRTITPEHVHSSFHTDMRDLNNLTAIYYLNTCNGYTMFNDGTKVESVENRLLLFDGSRLHCGTSPTDSKIRLVLNINYFPDKLPDGSPDVP